MSIVRVIHGPNLNLLGTREPDVYGKLTLSELNAKLKARADQLGVGLQCDQSNSEGGIIELIHAPSDGIVINPGGYTHTSVAIADAVRAVPKPTVEVHLSNLYAREDFRQRSFTASACRGVVMGLGANSYALALQAVAEMIGSTAGRR